MASIDITRIRQAWVDKTLDELKTVSRLAEQLGVCSSTAGRWIDPGVEATGRCIAAVLNNFPVEFDDAFVTVRVEVPNERVRLRHRRQFTTESVRV